MHYSIRQRVRATKSVITNIGLGVAALAFSAVIGLVGPTASAAAPSFGLQPFEFVGTAAQCAPAPAGTDTVTADWVNTTGNPAPSILLQKLGPTANCAAAGVDIITSLEGGPVSALTELNYDYRNDGHCGAGAPRFNIQTDQGTVISLGCVYGTSTPTADPNWTHVEFNQAQITAALVAAGINPLTATLEDLYIIFDEGSDTPVGGTIVTPGTVYLDNISVNNAVVGSPTNPASKEDCKKGGYANFVGANGQPFKNQGDCVSYQATKGKNLPDGAI